jgi:hypothetical protein
MTTTRAVYISQGSDQHRAVGCQAECLLELKILLKVWYPRWASQSDARGISKQNEVRGIAA